MKVLQIIDGFNYGGITKLITDIDNNISNDIKFDYITQVHIFNNKDNVYNLNSDRRSIKGKIVYNYRLYKHLKKNKYDIIHINSAIFLFSFQVALIAKLCGIKHIIAHSHNTINYNKLRRVIMKILSPLYLKLIDIKLTCSLAATKSLYTNTDNVILLKNGIAIDKYKYNKSIRNKYRKELNIEDKKVYGHVGRFSKQKNHEFLIDLFNEIQKKDDKAVLLLVGSGELEDAIRNKVKLLNIDDKVIFLGFRDNINEILNAFDVFLFPSLYEGLGIVAIEAQTNGLPVVVSNNVPSDANISNNFYKVDNYDIIKWMNTINNIKYYKRENAYKDTINNGYDIKDITKELEKIYRGLV
ncbi:MAG: glycosyltransferase [Bacilli bacterium]|nr:glycosyltransferase [Bacilli bacterium]